MSIYEKVENIQHQINELQSRIGYGTATEPKYSGEPQAVKRSVGNIENPVIIDVGSHFGEFIKEILPYYPQAKYYCFEPCKDSFQKLEDRYKSYGEITFNNCAVSDSEGIMKLYSHVKESSGASLIKRDLEYLGENFEKYIEEVKVIKLSSYLKNKKINQVDYLKLDVEGNEYSIVKDLKDYLAAKKIRNLQFEFGSPNIDSKIFLRDFYSLLRPLGYNLYRILPEGLYAANTYSELFEVFYVVNYLATVETLPEYF